MPLILMFTYLGIILLILNNRKSGIY